MIEINPLQKMLGIALGFAVILGVGGVTWKEESSRAAMSAAQAALYASSSAVIAAAPVQGVAKPAVVVSSATPARRRSDGDDNDEGTPPLTVPTSAPVVSTPPPATVPKQTASVYKDGTYTATGSYMSPAGEEQLGVTVTLANDIITNASVTPMAYGTSLGYQEAFISGYQQYVIGQNIANVNLTYVSGSSLTPAGFNDALSQIEAQAKGMIRFDFKAIGTSWRIDIHDGLDVAAAEKIRSRIMERIDIFDKAYSRFRADSIVTEMSKKVGAYELPADAEPMMSLYRDLYERTNGLVTPLVGNLISDAGYDAQYSLIQKKELEAPSSWDEAIEYAHPMLTMKKPVLLDFGAAGKGYLVDLVGEVLEQNGVKEYGIDAGGDILHRGKDAIQVGLEDPQDKNKVVGVCTLKNGSICGSAGNRRAWGKFTHIMDPKRLVSPTDIMAVWTIADNALVADGLSTCLFFVPPSILQKAYTFEYVIVRKDRSVAASPKFPGELFTVYLGDETKP